MSQAPAKENRFLTVPTGRLLVGTALPMTVVMMMSGLLSVVDAAFLGHFVGADALAAVSLIFPVVMAATALSVLVSGGMSSLLARFLGAGEREAAADAFAGAHGLAIAIALVMVGGYLLAGRAMVGLLAGGRDRIAEIAHAYLLITLCATPVQFLLGIHADAWRNEGRTGVVALLSVAVTLVNIGLNWLLIGVLGFGVAGSAWGTALAQGAGLGVLVGVRQLASGALLPALPLRRRWTGGWLRMLALGAPLSLSFIGMALVSVVVIASLRLTGEAGFAETVAAYGIVTRILGFAFLPLMAVALATQSIVGNNVGAGLYRRSDRVLRLAVLVAFGYCAGVETVLIAGRHGIGTAFVQDPAVVAEVGRILQLMVSLYLFTGPVLVLALYFQAVGQPLRAASLTLLKPFLFCPVLILALAELRGSAAVWLAFPLADGIVAVVAAAIISGLLFGRRRGGGSAAGFGLRVPGAQG